MILFQNLSVAAVVEQCSIAVEARFDTAREQLQKVEATAADVKATNEQVRFEIADAREATRIGSPIFRLADQTAREHRVQESQLESVVATLEIGFDKLRQQIQGSVASAGKQSNQSNTRIRHAQAVSTQVAAVRGQVAIAQAEMDQRLDEADTIRDRLRAVANR